MKIGFIGAGTVGTALAVRLMEKGYPVGAVWDLSPSKTRRFVDRMAGCHTCETVHEVPRACDLVFITTPDDAIEGVAGQIKWQKGTMVVHCSGVHSLEVLAQAAQEGAMVGAFHPLQTFSGVDHAIDNIPGSTFGVEAEDPLLADLKEMADALEGRVVVLKGDDKVLYHAAAVIACNYMVTLTKLATDLWQSLGVSPSDAIEALLPLIQGTVNNLKNEGLPHCLTGPVERGDLGTIRRHVKALKRTSPDLLDAYRQLGRHTVPIALAKGTIDKEKAEALITLFS